MTLRWRPYGGPFGSDTTSRATTDEGNRPRPLVPSPSPSLSLTALVHLSTNLVTLLIFIARTLAQHYNRELRTARTEDPNIQQTAGARPTRHSAQRHRHNPHTRAALHGIQRSFRQFLLLIWAFCARVCAYGTPAAPHWRRRAPEREVDRSLASPYGCSARPARYSLTSAFDSPRLALKTAEKIPAASRTLGPPKLPLLPP